MAAFQKSHTFSFYLFVHTAATLMQYEPLHIVCIQTGHATGDFTDKHTCSATQRLPQGSVVSSAVAEDCQVCQACWPSMPSMLDADALKEQKRRGATDLIGVIGQVGHGGGEAALGGQDAGVAGELLGQGGAPQGHLAVAQALDGLAQDHHLLHQVLGHSGDVAFSLNACDYSQRI